MRERFLEFIKKHALIQPQEQVLLAVSGGVDSMVLLELFHQCGIPCQVAHCNFGLRGADADADEALVKEKAEAHGIKVYSKRFETEQYAREHKLSIQMAARALRYDWFEELCAEHGLEKIATAHHLDDSLETVIHNLARGSAIAGLRGILPINGKVVRPLLDMTKQEIHDWAVEQKLAWREDASNSQVYYKRNFIRHKVVPLLEELNPDLLNTFRLSAGRNREVERVFLDQVADKREMLVTEASGHVRISKSPELGPHMLEHLLRPYGFNYSQACELVDGMNGLSGREFLSAGHRLIVDRGALVITPIEEPDSDEDFISEEDIVKEIGNKRYKLSFMPAHMVKDDWKKEANGLLDAERLEFPLTVRSWREGDSFQPLGMKGKKKLSDFMIDRKIPVNLKSRIRVLESAGEVVWVVGMRLDDRFKLTQQTRTAFCLIEE